MLQLEETEGHRVYLYVVNPLLAQKLEAMVGQADLSREVCTWSYTTDGGVFPPRDKYGISPFVRQQLRVAKRRFVCSWSGLVVRSCNG